MRQRDPLTLEEARELDALERALAGEPVDPDLRELAELVSDVRATSPRMSPGFAARLEHDVAEGFPASSEPAAPRRARRWLLLPAGGCLAAAVVAIVVVAGNRGPGPGDGALSSTGLAAPAQTAPDVAGARGESAPLARKSTAPEPAAAAPQSSSATVDRAGAPAPAGAGAGAGAGATGAVVAPPAVAAQRGPRKQERSADLELRVSNARVQSTADAVISTVDRFGGIVAASTISSQGRHGEASFQLRIPTSRLDDALAALSKLGHVASRNQSLVDITGSFTSVQDRLSDARAERRGLLGALGHATTKAQIDSLRARLRNVRSQIARLNGDLDALRRRADLSSVSVTVRGVIGSSPEAGAGSGGGWSPADAARDAVRVLEVIAGVTLVALAVLTPLALLAGLVAIGVRTGRRRRREGALDPA
ncbi:MAG: hypothetical protein QOJ35_564 [Solirubrobacteraceae bacterium]|jgi:hypothetical protein|nr:hypothetical protein [Solirubrobacteraceae bacterium]